MTIPGPMARVIIAAGVALAAGACAYRGVDDPVVRKFSWFSYVGADDVRVECRAGAPERYRLVYNAIYQEQVRTYDIVVGAGDGEGRMVVRVTSPPDISNIDIDPGNVDLQAPWRSRRSETVLRPADVAKLRQGLDSSDFFGPAPVGLELPSDGFYWIGAACAGGRFHYNAFLWPSPRFERLAFPSLVFSWDFTGIEVNPPRRVTKFDLYGSAQQEADISFQLRIGENGLWGARPRL